MTNSRQVCELVSAGEVDLGFVESPQLSPDLRSQVVARDRLLLVVVSTHPWARRGRTVVGREPGSGTRVTMERAPAAAGHPSGPPLLELGSSTAIRAAALAGVGPAVPSELVVGEDVAAGTLVAIPVNVDLSRELRAVWQLAQPPPGPAARLVALAAES